MLRKNGQNILRFLGYYCSFIVLSILCKSLKVEKVNFESLEKLKSDGFPYVIAFWHGTMLLPWYLHGNPDVVALTSRSKDGELLARLLKRWNYQVIRCSSSSGGEIALEIMIGHAKNNSSIAITTDGPRGPRH